MKTLLIAVSIIFVASMGYCIPNVVRSSFTATADSSKTLCPGSTRGYLYGVVVSSAGAVGSGLTIYNSSFTATAPVVADIDTRTLGNYSYGFQMTAGMLYSKAGTATVNILYDCR